jgi:hypothetical protein
MENGLAEPKLIQVFTAFYNTNGEDLSRLPHCSIEETFSY